jgi:hypothetical protein
MKGHGMFLHRDPDDRPANVFGGTTTLWSLPVLGTAWEASYLGLHANPMAHCCLETRVCGKVLPRDGAVKCAMSD